MIFHDWMLRDKVTTELKEKRAEVYDLVFGYHNSRFEGYNFNDGFARAAVRNLNGYDLGMNIPISGVIAAQDYEVSVKLNGIQDTNLRDRQRERSYSWRPLSEYFLGEADHHLERLVVEYDLKKQRDLGEVQVDLNAIKESLTSWTNFLNATLKPSIIPLTLLEIIGSAVLVNPPLSKSLIGTGLLTGAALLKGYNNYANALPDRIKEETDLYLYHEAVNGGVFKPNLL